TSLRRAVSHQPDERLSNQSGAELLIPRELRGRSAVLQKTCRARTAAGWRARGTNALPEDSWCSPVNNCRVLYMGHWLDDVTKTPLPQCVSECAPRRAARQRAITRASVKVSTYEIEGKVTRYNRAAPEGIYEVTIQTRAMTGHPSTAAPSI